MRREGRDDWDAPRHIEDGHLDDYSLSSPMQQNI